MRALTAGLQSDWMHDTIFCFGYPSDSSRAALQAGPGHCQGASAALLLQYHLTSAKVTSATAHCPRVRARWFPRRAGPFQAPGPAGSGTHYRPRSWPIVWQGSVPPASGRRVGYGAGGPPNQLLGPASDSATNHWSCAVCCAARWRAGSPSWGVQWGGVRAGTAACSG
jgi:hypothetical protein